MKKYFSVDLVYLQISLINRNYPDTYRSSTLNNVYFTLDETCNANTLHHIYVDIQLRNCYNFCNYNNYLLYNKNKILLGLILVILKVKLKLAWHL